MKFLTPYLLIITLIIWPLTGACQTILSLKAVDSLKRAIKKTSSDTSKLNALHLLGTYYHQRHFKLDKADLDTALFYFSEELALSQQLRVDEGSGLLESLCSLGEVYISKNMVEESKACFMQVCVYYQNSGNKKMEGRTLLRFGKACNISTWFVRPGNLFAELIKNGERAAGLFISIGDSGDELIAYTNLAATYFTYGQFDQAEAQCMRGINKYPDKQIPEFSGLYYVLAHIQRYRGNLNRALFYALKSMKQLEKNPDGSGKVYEQSMLYGELALIYDALGQTDNSITWYKKTLAIRENLAIKLEFKYRTAGFIVQGLIKQKKYNEAFATALGVERRHPPDNAYNRAIISQVKAYCYDAVGDNARAEQLYLLALNLFGPTKTDEIVSLAKYDIARFYIKTKEYQKAAFYLNEGASNSFSVTRLRDYHLIFYKIDSAKGQYASALQHHILYKTYNDSIFNTEKNRQIQELQVQFETDQKERDIRALKKESNFQHDKATQANNIRNLTLAGSGMLVILLALIYSNFRAKQRSNIALSALVTEKDGLLKEKEWLIKEIHHRVKNNLQIVMGLLQRQSAFIDNEAALQAIQESESRMHSIALIHQKLYQSESLDLISMPEYITELLSYLNDSSGTVNRIKFEKQTDDICLDVSQAVPLGLILNEAITNAIKYAYPDDAYGVVRVILKRLAHAQVVLIIEDEGSGLPVGFETGKANSLGMSLMKGLSKQIGGIFEIKNNNGVSVQVTFKTESFPRQIGEPDRRS